MHNALALVLSLSLFPAQEPITFEMDNSAPTIVKEDEASSRPRPEPPTATLDRILGFPREYEGQSIRLGPVMLDADIDRYGSSAPDPSLADWFTVDLKDIRSGKYSGGQIDLDILLSPAVARQLMELESADLLLGAFVKGRLERAPKRRDQWIVRITRVELLDNSGRIIATLK